MARLILLAAIAVLIPGNSGAQEKTQGKAEKPKMQFWAAIGSQTPIYDLTQNKDPDGLRLEFMIVNDGPNKADPHEEKADLLVDGKVSKEAFWIMNNGLFEADPALAPGEVRRTTRTLGNVLAEPGIHKLVWKNKFFESPEFTIRILGPRKKDW